MERPSDTDTGDHWVPNRQRRSCKLAHRKVAGQLIKATTWFHLLEPALAVLTLLAHPAVVARAAPVDAPPRVAAFFAGLEGRGGG